LSWRQAALQPGSERSTAGFRFNALALNRAAPLNQPSSFNTVEKVSVAFVQTDLETEVFGRTLRTNVGVRHVKTDVDIDNFLTDGQGGFAPANRVSEYSHTLPSASLAYNLMRDLVLRGSVGKTFKRSSVSAISKTYGVRGTGGNLEVNAGNPELLPEESSSRDWGLEWYFAKGGVLALAGYDKSFTGRLANGESVKKFDEIGLPKSLFTSNNFTLSDNPDVTVFLPKNAEAYASANVDEAVLAALPAMSVNENSRQDYGTGAFLMAGSEVLRALGGASAKKPVQVMAEAQALFDAQSQTPRAMARLVPERMDDLAWENDKVAHRIYGPAVRASLEDSGIDVGAAIH